MAKKEKTLSSVFFNGILNENPTLRLVLGICPTLASTTSATNAVGMGAAATFVLVGSNVVISLLRNIVPALYASLGIFIPLIVVNCIILARAEAFASKNGPLLSAADGLGMGAGFTLAITVIGMVREILGSGSIFGISIFGAGFEPMLLALMAPGGFIVFGLVLGIANYFTEKAAKKKSDEKGVIRA